MRENRPAINLSDCARCAGYNLRRVSRLLSQAYDDALRPSGLKGTQFSLLANVAGRGRMSITALADVMGMDRTTLTRNLKPLEREQLVTVLSGTDRRTREITVTKGGKAALELAYPLWQQAQKQAVSKLGKKRFARLLDDLAALSS